MAFNRDKEVMKFSDHYKEELFLLWYTEGKPSLTALRNIIPKSPSGHLPTLPVLQKWARDNNWRDRAEKQDEKVRQELEEKLVAVKVEMLERHAETGKEIQQIGLDYIRDNPDKITPGIAVRMIVEGIRVEEGSRGIGAAFKKAVEMTDEDLLSTVEDLLLKSKVEILPLEDGNQTN